MKKVLISILIVLLVVLAYITIFNGLSLGNIRIMSVDEIIQANDDLTNDIEQVKSLLERDYPAKKDELSSSVTELLNRKQEYFKLAKISTEGEITKANTEETYLIEYLWTRVGRHATSKGVNIKMDVNTSDTGDANIKNLGFKVNGQYIAIIQFVSALENDDKLNFKIEDFKMVKDTGNEAQKGLIATFNVRGIRIKAENLLTTTDEMHQPKENIESEQLNTTENTESTNDLVEAQQ